MSYFIRKRESKQNNQIGSEREENLEQANGETKKYLYSTFLFFYFYHDSLFFSFKKMFFFSWASPKPHIEFLEKK